MILSGIYKITNNKNKKVYIGQSRNILQRWQEHINNAFLETKNEYFYPLQSDFRNMGISSFSFEILETGIYDKIELDKRERFYISFYNSYNEGYNQNSGNNSSLKIIGKKEWTKEEISLLTALVKQGFSQEKISERLGRTKKSINTKISRLGIGPRVNHPWTKQLEQEMLKLRNESYTQKEAGEILGFSKEAVKKRWHDIFSNTEGEWRKK